MKDLKNAVKTAFTYLVANPEDEESLGNVRFYMDQDGYDESMLVDAWQMAYERHYMSGVNAYKDEDWQKCVNDMNLSLDELFEEENRCRTMCDDELDWSSLQGDNPEYSIVVTSSHDFKKKRTFRCLHVDYLVQIQMHGKVVESERPCDWEFRRILFRVSACLSVQL